ncbi:hypothetical protein TorRG33x02_249050 [Trema orientale]|uniref:Uncharacterized protein n=1 Tax=Trema orientale TaxID=63057 RepID=A0A2P5DK20_TREOI|nr:hypothetical protein TorRG33x02_249050 [Trema orientale]
MEKVKLRLQFRRREKKDKSRGYQGRSRWQGHRFQIPDEDQGNRKNPCKK